MRKRLRKKLARRKALERFRAIALYLVQESQGARWLQAPKRDRRAALYALLFMIDFKSYAEQGKGVTGMDWAKGRTGPEPRFPRFEA
jgi:hypothetical protein